MKTRINVYGLTAVAIIVFFIYLQKWKYDHEKEILSQLKQTAYLDELRFAAKEMLVSQNNFNELMRNEGDKQELDEEYKTLKQADADILKDDQKQIEEFSRDHGF